MSEKIFSLAHIATNNFTKLRAPSALSSEKRRDGFRRAILLSCLEFSKPSCSFGSRHLFKKETRYWQRSEESWQAKILS